MVLLKMVKNAIVVGRKTVLKIAAGPNGQNILAINCHAPSGQLNSAAHLRALAVTGSVPSILVPSVEMITGVVIKAIAMARAHTVHLLNLNQTRQFVTRSLSASKG